MTRPYNNNKKNPAEFVDFAVLADHWVKLKESRKKDKFLNTKQNKKKAKKNKKQKTNQNTGIWK